MLDIRISMEYFQIARLQENASRKQTARSRIYDPPLQTVKSETPSKNPSAPLAPALSETPSMFKNPDKSNSISKRIVPFVTNNFSDIHRAKSASPTGRIAKSDIPPKRLSSKTKLLVLQLKEKEKAKQNEEDRKVQNMQDPKKSSSPKSTVIKSVVNKEGGDKEPTQKSEELNISQHEENFDLLSVLSTEEKLVFDKYVKSFD